MKKKWKKNEKKMKKKMKKFHLSMKKVIRSKAIFINPSRVMNIWVDTPSNYGLYHCSGTVISDYPLHYLSRLSVEYSQYPNLSRWILVKLRSPIWVNRHSSISTAGKSSIGLQSGGRPLTTYYNVNLLIKLNKY